MKKINLKLSFLIILLAVMSCKKEVSNKDDSSTQIFSQRGCSTCSEGISMICDGILHFPSMAAYDSTVDCLEQEYEAYNDAFESTYAYLDDSTYNVVADSLGFNEDQTLLIFERCFSNFKSLRSVLDSIETEWIDTHNLDSLHDPINWDVTGDDFENTLLNRYNEVSIGDSIYVFNLDGSTFSIHNSDCKILDNIRGNPDHENARNAGVIVVLPTPQGINCRQEREGRYELCEDYIDRNYKIKCYQLTKYNRVSENSKMISKIKSFKKKSNGGYKKYKKTIRLEMYLRVYQTDCEPNGNWPRDKEKRRKKISKRIKPGGKFWIKTNTTQTYYKVTYSVVRDTTAYIVW